ncbi:TfoX/Sxy family protein [Pseudarthrobacter sp. NamE2]|uniref:TfoX/Sxy family protein n=1 Tax=Pseudarthrobacter sp. NamE2 TaxID=2576838 RepID=UPI0010FDD073|nr:TfoX/Sxy family protein [Pseudarthrobacter sp. NamE2]TLM80969.1 TfoX/Sxy family protein [Pseudarthrobacter sp. NamE2]
MTGAGVRREQVRDLLTSSQTVREVRMFGRLSFMVDDRTVVAAGHDGDLRLHANPDAHKDLLDRGGQPANMGKDRPSHGPGVD